MFTWFSTVSMDTESNNDNWIALKEERRQAEIAALTQHVLGEVPYGPAWRILADLGDDADVCYTRIIEMVRVVLSASHRKWPDDDAWRRLVSSWFRDATRDYTRAEYEALLTSVPETEWYTLPWDFDSWVDAIRDREWRWWSSWRMNGSLEIYLLLDGWPAMLDAFEQIIEAAGGTIAESEAVP
jgi:hypothetical protein